MHRNMALTRPGLENQGNNKENDLLFSSSFLFSVREEENNQTAAGQHRNVIATINNKRKGKKKESSDGRIESSKCWRHQRCEQLSKMRRANDRHGQHLRSYYYGGRHLQNRTRRAKKNAEESPWMTPRTTPPESRIQDQMKGAKKARTAREESPWTSSGTVPTTQVSRRREGGRQETGCSSLLALSLHTHSRKRRARVEWCIGALRRRGAGQSSFIYTMESRLRNTTT